MAELNLNQIIDRLNKEFVSESRRLVFWYDDKGEFAEDIDSIELANAKIWRLENTNQFYTKYYLERIDKDTNYLIYAPFPKPDVSINHLEDTLLYSKRFFADRASLLMVDLGIEEQYKPVIERHIKYFASKDRTQRFYDLDIEKYTEETIIVGMLGGICRTKRCSFEEVLCSMITEGDLDGNRYIEEFEKYDLLPEFWQLCEQQFGYTDPKPSLEKLIFTLYITAANREISGNTLNSWKPFISYKLGNITAFLDGLANNTLTRERYDELSDYVASKMDFATVIRNFQPCDLIECDTFRIIDQLLIYWINERLLQEDISAKLGNYTIPKLCEKRMKMHFGQSLKSLYQLLLSGYFLVSAANYSVSGDFSEINDRYLKMDFNIDMQYRKFYLCYDRLEDTGPFEELRTLVENIYTNEYLEKLLPKWTEAFLVWSNSAPDMNSQSDISLQRDFFDHVIRNLKEKTVVIISDALRYEVGREIFSLMESDPKCTAKMNVQLSVLPSYTPLGMAALLPHKKLVMTDDYKVLIDGSPNDDIAKREILLQKDISSSACVKLDSIKTMKKNELRDLFTGKQVVYVYQNQIDARGEALATENEVFVACEEAITEVIDLIRRLSVNANTYHFIVTSDHGFIYKRDKLPESDKINRENDKKAFSDRRFIISNEPVKADGVQSIQLSSILKNDDSKFVSFPISGNVFKASGGMNYVHGGASPQEMLVPIIDIKMERGKIETHPVKITLVSMVQKITNLLTMMDFMQSEPVSDIAKPAIYKLFFISEDNEKISNENIYVADSKETEGTKRIVRLTFSFKNKKYDKNRQYYLIAYDNDSGIELFRHPVIMDLAFADDFGF